MDDKAKEAAVSDAVKDKEAAVNVQLPASNGDGPRNLTITLAISIQVMEIPGVSIGLAGVDLKHAGPAAADMATIQACLQQQSASSRNVDDSMSVTKEKKKATFFPWKKKPQQQQQPLQQQQQTEIARPVEAVPPDPAATQAAQPATLTRALPSAAAGDSGSGVQPPQPPMLPPPPSVQSASQPAGAASSVAGVTAALLAATSNSAGKMSNADDSKGDDSSDDEIDMTKPAAALGAAGADMGRNTVESDAGDTGENTCGSSSAKEKGSAIKKFQLFGKNKKDKGKGYAESGSFNFPQDVPDNAKTLFQIMSDMRLITTIYTSNAGRTAAVKKQKALLTETAEKRFTVDGKSRSVWLDPPPGEKVEIWKEYFGDDGECNRALGRLPGTDKYGYILRDEIDEEKQFPTKEETQAYNDSLQLLTMFMDIYGNE